MRHNMAQHGTVWHNMAQHGKMPRSIPRLLLYILPAKRFPPLDQTTLKIRKGGSTLIVTDATKKYISHLLYEIFLSSSLSSFLSSESPKFPATTFPPP